VDPLLGEISLEREHRGVERVSPDLARDCRGVDRVDHRRL
jgi:hypothetical protein